MAAAMTVLDATVPDDDAVDTEDAADGTVDWLEKRGTAHVEGRDNKDPARKTENPVFMVAE